LVAIQFAAALPWLWALDPKTFREQARSASGLTWFFGSLAGIAVLMALFFGYQKGSAGLEDYGRLYASLLHIQFIADLFVGGFQLLLVVWPKGGAMALSAFREHIRAPMFWLMGAGASGLLVIAMIIPYFTFGDDYKMMKQICFDVAMLAPVAFGVLMTSISINDEIEGRTAITVISKPVTRRQFLLGKYLGALMAALALTLVIGWVLVWVLYVQPRFNPLDPVLDPMPTQTTFIIAKAVLPNVPPDTSIFVGGAVMWTGEALGNSLGLILGFGQVMVLLAITAALSTRIPMAANSILILAVFFLGHLAPVMHRAAEDWKTQNPGTAVSLVSFLTQLLETLTPTLEFFNMGPAIIRDAPLNVGPFALYVGTVFVYATVYTAIALLGGLILFEDRDLA
jgi:ABC-type transport system involved in multi-copper enzyme maturation permease subunit